MSYRERVRRWWVFWEIFLVMRVDRARYEWVKKGKRTRSERDVRLHVNSTLRRNTGFYAQGSPSEPFTSPLSTDFFFSTLLYFHLLLIFFFSSLSFCSQNSFTNILCVIPTLDISFPPRPRTFQVSPSQRPSLSFIYFFSFSSSLPSFATAKWRRSS